MTGHGLSHTVAFLADHDLLSECTPYERANQNIDYFDLSISQPLY